jgi:alkylglycerol monooxygenase
MGQSLIALAIPFFVLGIGVELLASWRQKKPVYELGDSISSMGCGIAQQLVSNSIAAALVGAAYQAAYGFHLFTLPTWLDWSLAVFGVEFAYYWWHRLSHEVNLLWAAHVVHHQSSRYNLSTALRQSVATWLTTLPFYLPLAVLGVSFKPFAIVLSLSTLYQFWIHTELIGSLGWFEWLFNTPSQHRVHHATNRQYLDKNHSATFAFFDRIFGTFQLEEETCVYGTTQPLRSLNPLWAQIDTVNSLVRASFQAPTLRESISLFFWSPATPIPWLTKRSASQPPAPTVSPARWRYSLAQWCVLIAGVFVFLMWGIDASLALRATALTAIAMSLVTLSALMESRRWAVGAEAARVLLLCCGLVYWAW